MEFIEILHPIYLIGYWNIYMYSVMQKRVFGYMRTVKAQICLRIRTVWSGPSLSANRVTGYYSMY